VTIVLASLFYLAIAIVAVYLWGNVKNEITQVLVAGGGAISMFFSLIYAPVAIKLLIVFVLLSSHQHAKRLN
jgi:hypothetical protein